MFKHILAVIWLGIAGVAAYSGLPYYLTTLPERPYSPLHQLFAPTGLIGQGYGVIGSLLVATGVTLYGIRKRARFMAGWGRLEHWLQAHIFLCTLGPFLIVLHTTFKFGGVVSLSFWSMAMVVASGMFGRYVYVRIPKSVNGRFLSGDALRAQQEDLVRRIGLEAHVSDDGALARALAGAPPQDNPRIISALAQSFAHRWGRRARHRTAHAALEAHGVAPVLRSMVIRLVDEQDRLRNQAALLIPFQRMFRYWHALHLPLAGVMFAILLVHVAVAVAFGYTWIF